MAFSLFVKMVMAATLSVMLILSQTHAQTDSFDELLKKVLEEYPEMKEEIDEIRNREEEGPKCPPEYMEFYKDCKGTLKTCSQCLSDAERECDRADRVARADGVGSSNGGTCFECTTVFADRCDAAESMCFGYQDCGGRDLHCINFKCEYDT